MTALDVELTNFTAGELSPRLRGRVDLDQYHNGCETLLNMVVMPQGGATRRPGTRNVAVYGDSTHSVALVPFIFSTVQAYIIELGQNYARFFTNDGLVSSMGTPVSISTPYAAADLALLQFVQSADEVYFMHPNHPVQLLSRLSGTSWTLAPVAFRDGPYLQAAGDGVTTLTPSGTSGSITLTASGLGQINGGQGFLASDVGRSVRIKDSALWGWAVITAVGSTTVVTATVMPLVGNGAQGSLDGTAATLIWGLGKWSGTTGYPYAAIFWQNRLVFCGTNNQPNAVEGSVIGDFTNFAPTQVDSTVDPVNAVSWLLNDNQVNAIRALVTAGSAQTMQLGILTSGSEKIMQPAVSSQALGPNNVQAYEETHFGSAANVQPIRVVKSALFVDRSGLKVHEWTFNWQVNGYVGPDLAVLAEHIPKPGLARSAYQQLPHGIAWYLRGDGQLVGLTYLRDQGVIAWHRHRLGGQYYGGPARVESIACIPSPDGTSDELWLAVLRTVNGVILRSIEVMTPYFDDQPTEEAVFVDCSVTTALTFPAGIAGITGLTNTAKADADPSWGGTGTLTVAGGSVPAAGTILRMNGGMGIMGAGGAVNVLRPMTGLGPAANGAWSATAPSASVAGLDYLAGEIVGGVAEGLVVPAVAQSGDTRALAQPATVITMGLPYVSRLVPFPVDPAQRAGAVAGRAKRLDHEWLRLHETVGGQFGQVLRDDLAEVDEDILEDLVLRQAGDSPYLATAPYSGVKKLGIPGGNVMDGRLIFRQADPLPMTLLAVNARMELTDVTAEQGR